MSDLMIGRDSHIMMLEFAVEKLFIPSHCPFDSVVMTKFITSFRFLDDDWIDVMPNRLDYRPYQGSTGQVQLYHGGKSVVFAVPQCRLREPARGEVFEIRVRREISRYFEAEEHAATIGRARIDADGLINEIVDELALRRSLADYLELVHERDPVSSSLKCKLTLQQPDSSDYTDCCMEIYLRLSYLDQCIVTELERPSRDPCSHVYAQEETNRAMPYECLQLAECEKPSAKSPLYPRRYERECACTDEQRNRMLEEVCRKTCGTDTYDDKDKRRGKKEKKKKRKKKEKETRKDRGTGTEAETADAMVGPDGEAVLAGDDGAKKKFDLDELLRRLRAKNKGGGGGGQVIMPDKQRPCPATVCEPCDPCCLPVSVVDEACCPLPACPPPVYCCN